MDRKNWSRKIVLLLAGLLLLIPIAAEAIAIAPGTVDFAFAPNAVREFELHVINNDAFAEEITLYVKGDLAGYVQLPVASLALKPNEEQIITVKINLPANQVFGSARVGAATKAGSGDGIGAMVAVESRVTVSGVETERQAKQSQANAALEVLGVSITKTAGGGLLDISVANNGGADVEAYAEANLDADTGKASVTTPSRVVPANGKQILSAPINNVLASAKEYKADVVIYYGSNSVKKSVSVGGAGITGGAVASLPELKFPSLNFKSDYLLIIVVALFIVIDAIIIIKHRQRFKY